MPTSTRYDTIRAQVAAHAPALRPRLLDPLACALVGISQTVSPQQNAIASAMPLETKQASKVQRLRRLLENEQLSAPAVYHPVVTPALAGLTGQRVHVLLDRVVLSAHQNVLVVSLGFRRRSLPLVWKMLPHQGSSCLADQQEVVAAAIALLPPQVRVTVHADSEFRSVALFTWLRAQGWNAMLGIRGQQVVSHDTTVRGTPLATWLPDRATVVYLEAVWVGEDQYGPVNIIAWWDKDDRNSLTCYAVMTNLSATWHTYRIGSRRMWIETLFRDWQSGGFALAGTAIRDRARFTRLLILICLVYVWFVAVGRWLVKRGYRTLLDMGSSHAWEYSLFSLAVAWQQRQRTFDRPFPVFWFMYP